MTAAVITSLHIIIIIIILLYIDTKHSLKLEFHDADTADTLARILAGTSDARFPEVIPMASSTTRRRHRHSRENVGVGVVECQLNHTQPLLSACRCKRPVIDGPNILLQ